MSSTCENMLANIRVSLDKEFQNDLDMKHKLGDKWNRMSSQQTQKDYRTLLQDYSGKYLIAKSVDQPMLALF